MADHKGSAGKSGMNVDTALVRELAEMLGDTGLTEIEVEDGERKIRVSRGGVPMAAPMQMAAPAPAAAAPDHEGVLVDWLHEAHTSGAKAVLLNAAAYTHTSIALLDAIKAIDVPVIEVHLSDPATREGFRHLSYVGMAAVDEVKGMGANGYAVALEKAAAL